MSEGQIRKRKFDFTAKRVGAKAPEWMHETPTLSVCSKCGKVGVLEKDGKTMQHVVSRWTLDGRVIQGYETLAMCILSNSSDHSDMSPANVAMRRLLKHQIIFGLYGRKIPPWRLPNGYGTLIIRR